MVREAADKSGTDYLAGQLLAMCVLLLSAQLVPFDEYNISNLDWAKRPKFSRRLLVDGKRLAATPLAHFGKAHPGLTFQSPGRKLWLESLIEGRIVPQNYGYEDLDSFVIAIVNRFLNNASAATISVDSN